MIRLFTLVLIAILGLSDTRAQGFKLPADLVRASLVAEPGAIEAGRPFTVGIRMTMRPHWHVYWRNPGDSGLPPELAWTLPPGFSAGAIAWPAPSRIPVSHLVNFGFEDTVTLLVEVTPPAELASGRPATLSARLTYLVCERECVPGSAALRLALPVAAAGTSAGPSPQTRDFFATARAALPVSVAWPTRLEAAGERLALSLEAPGLRPEAIGEVAYFPYSETAIEHAAAQEAAVDARGIRLTLARGNASEAAPRELPGVLTFLEETPEGRVRRAFAIGREPEAGAAAAAPAEVPAAAAGAPEEALTLWAAAGFAFLGGLILNLMPCVFPVLSIKVLGLVRHSSETSARVRLHGLAYTAGVLTAFLSLAGLLIALKGAGAGIGWGYQLQSPVVVAGLAYLLLAMGLSLSGVVHLGSGIAGLGDGLTRRPGLEGSFFAGMLAAVVATPCTAPFMGAAVGFALTQDAPVGLAVFACLGLGLALPFLALTAFPGALRRLPRPGAWMETMKGLLAFPLYATVAWLVWVLAQQVGADGLLAGLAGLVLVGFSAWSWERARAAGPFGATLARGAALAALAGVIGVAASLEGGRAGAGPGALVAEGSEPFTQARLDALREDGRPVFVNMTAAWCITCQVNERAALGTQAVRDAFKARGVTVLTGDWTNQNPEITRLLERHGRSGVPLYLLYAGAGAAAVLPQILTPGLVIEALSRLPSDHRAALETTTSETTRR